MNKVQVSKGKRTPPYKEKQLILGDRVSLATSAKTPPPKNPRRDEHPEEFPAMKIRVVQIWGFLMTVLGWIFVACTIAMEGWKVTSIGGMGGSSIIKVAWYWSSLWRACFTDSTAITNCYDFPVLWSVDGHIQVVRGLLIGALSLGALGFVLSMIGMECTFLGGKEIAKHKKVYAGGCFHVLSGVLSTCGYAVYAHYVSGEYFNPYFDGLKFDLGTPLFLGWVGSAFHITGGCFYLWASCKPLCGGEVTTIVIPAVSEVPEKTKFTTALYTLAEIPSKSKLSSSSSSSSSSSPSSTARSEVSGFSSRAESSSGSSRSAGRRPPRPRSPGSSVSESSPLSRSSESGGGGTRRGGNVSSRPDRSRSGRIPFLNTNYV